MESIEAYIEEDDSYEMDTDPECAHSSTSNIDGSTVCMDCGVKLGESLLDNEVTYYGSNDTRFAKDPSRHNQRKAEERSLHSDLEPLGFPQEIIERANVYYKEIIKNKIYRAGNRLSIVFACTYYAYCDIMEPRVPSELAQRFKLDKKGVSNGFKIFSHAYTKRPDKKYIDAMDLVPKLLSELNIDKKSQKVCRDDIQIIYDFVHTKSKIFNSSNPQSVASGLIYYYFKINDVPITRSEFSRVVHLTDITFTKIACNVHSILGNPAEIKF